MKVLIDADACPVTDIAVRLCKASGVPCLILCDTAHAFEREDAEIILVDKGADSVDFALVNRTEQGDLVITQDYGLASMCLAKKARVLHQDGWEYTENNIGGLMEQRYAAKKYRMTGGRTKGPKKREQQQNTLFTISMQALLQKMLQG